MGNSTPKTKIIILDEFRNILQFNKFFLDFPELQFKHYLTFEDFIEKENLRQLSNIILKERVEKQQSNKRQKTLLDVSPFANTKMKSNRDKIIHHIKKYNIQHLNFYLYVEDTTNLRVNSFQKPFIKLSSGDLNVIIDDIRKGKSLISLNIKFKKLVEDLYRKIVVKIIDPRFIVEQSKKKEMSQQMQNDIKMFKKSVLSFQYFASIEDYEKSCLSTNCEFIVCFPDNISALIDSKNSYDHEYNIILRGSNQKLKKKGLWFISQNLEEIIQKMRCCTELKVQQKPQLSTNTILIGDDWIYEEKFEEIKKKIEEQFKKTDEKKYNFLNIHYFSGDSDFDDVLDVLKKSYLSYMVVFSIGDYLERIKKRLRSENFERRVQITAIPDSSGCKNDDQIIDKKVHYFVNEIKFKIKSEIAPLEKLFFYRYNSNEMSQMKKKFPMIVQNIKNFEELKQDYLPPCYRKHISGEHIICGIQSYKKDLKGIFQKFPKTYFERLKIIIYDDRFSVKSFVENESNYSPLIVLVHYNINKILQYLSYCHAPIVSIPFFRKKVLRNFEATGKQIAMMKLSGQISIQTSVISTNQLLKQIFESKVRISVDYKVQLIRFPSHLRGIDRDISFYEDKYLQDYAKLWHIGYDIFKTDENGQYVNFEILKGDIKQCLYKCKAYQLLRVTDEEFQTLYIDMIQQSSSFLDLQTACIYIISLPHGLASSVNNLFKRPRKTKLAIKIFSHFVLVLFTAFSLHNGQMMENIELLSYFDDNQLKGKLNALKVGDVLYNSALTFCCKNQTPEQNKHNNCFIFQFQNIPFLQKSRIQSTLDIEGFSFYKEGAQYLISPFTQFFIKSIEVSQEGKYHFRFMERKEGSGNSFLHKVLRQNQITEQKLFQNVQNFVDKLGDKKNSRFLSTFNMKFYEEQKSLYRKAQRFGFMESKIQLLKSLEKQLVYNEFYFAKNNRLYISAEKALNKKIFSGTGNNNASDIKNDYFSNLLQIQKAYLYFKTTRYSLSLSTLQNVRKYLLDEHALPQSEWIIQTINKFISCVEGTINHRKNVFNEAPKKKKWSVKAYKSQKGNRVNFKLSSIKQQWTVDYSHEAEKFYIRNNQIPQELLIPAEPENEFGNQVLTWVGNDPFNYLILEGQEDSKKNIINQLLKEQDTSEQNKSIGLFFQEKSKLRKSSESKDSIIEKKNIKETFKKMDKQYRSYSVHDNYQEKEEDEKKNMFKKKMLKSQKQMKKSEQKPMFIIEKGQNTKRSRQKVLKFVLDHTNLYEGQQESNYTQKLEWKVFYLDNEVNVVRKGKHFHMKIGNMGKNKRHSKKPKRQKIEQNYILQ